MHQPFPATKRPLSQTQPAGSLAATVSPSNWAAFFNALNACGSTLGGHLHPVCARNSGILAVWQAIESKTSDAPRSPLGSLRRTFRQNLALLRDTVTGDPLWRQGRIKIGGDPGDLDSALVLAAAPLMFWNRSNALIETTDALERMLVDSDLGEDLPAELFRPPFPACFIRFGEVFQSALVPATGAADFGPHRPQGVYVFESLREEQRALTLVPIYAMHAPARFAAGTMELIIGDEAGPLEQTIRAICRHAGTGQGPHYESLASIIAKVFLYMGLAQMPQVEQRDYAAAQERLRHLGPKKAARLERQLAERYDRIVIGPQTIDAHGHGEVSPHLRRGHFRMQPHGPQLSLRKLIFISPIWVRADRLAIPA